MITILYIDDEQLNLFLFKQNFNKEFNVLLCDSAEEGLDIYSKNNSEIDIVISDMKMPGINGVDFIRKIKKLDSKIPCFILTGFDITPEIHKALKNKILEGYFQKPFDIQNIRTTIYNIVPNG